MQQLLQGIIRKNLTKLLGPNDTMVVDREGIKDIAHTYFGQLFQPKASNYAPVVDALDSCITSIDNEMLTEPLHIEEIKAALSEMHPRKSPYVFGYREIFGSPLDDW